MANGDVSSNGPVFCIFPEHTPKPIFTQNGLIDVDSRKDVPFAVKIETFSNP